MNMDVSKEMAPMKLPDPRNLPVVEAARALGAVLRNPDDTKQFFRLLKATSGTAPEAFARRFEASRGGARLLEGRPSIFARLRDREALRALPEGSLGRAYVAFMERGGLDAEWLVEASSEAGPPNSSGPVGEYLAARMRDAHDLWHVVLGYEGDLLGEAAVLAFTFAQTRSAGIGLLVSAALLRADDPDARSLIIDAFARGIRAAWFVAAPWESWLDRPLEEVRTVLRAGPPPTYEPFFAKDLPPGGVLGRA